MLLFNEHCEQKDEGSPGKDASVKGNEMRRDSVNVEPNEGLKEAERGVVGLNIVPAENLGVLGKVIVRFVVRNQFHSVRELQYLDFVFH